MPIMRVFRGGPRTVSPFNKANAAILVFCVMSFIMNAIMLATVRTLRKQVDSIFLFSLSLLVGLEMLLCIFASIYAGIMADPYASGQAFMVAMTVNQFQNDGIILVRNMWIVCVTVMRMLKVCFPLKERVLVNSKRVKIMFATLCLLGSAYATVATYNVRWPFNGTMLFLQILYCCHFRWQLSRVFFVDVPWP